MQVHKIAFMFSAFMLNVLFNILPLRKIAIANLFLSFIYANIYFLIYHILCIKKISSILIHFILYLNTPNFLREALVEQECNKEQ